MLGSKGGLDFSIGKKYKNAGKPLTSTLGRGADMVRSGIYSKKYGGADGEGGSFWAGAWRGRHGFNKGKEATDVRREVLSGGSTFGGRLQDRLRNAIGLKSRADAADFRTDMEIRRNGQLLDDQIRDVDGRIKTAERPLKDAKVEEREANNTEASNYRSNITNSIQQQARRSTSQFNYGGLKSNSYVNGNGKREDLSGKTYAELESLYNAGRTSGLASSELTKIKNQMDTRFYTDTSGNKVEISGTHQNLVSARDNAISSVGLHAKSDGSQYTVRELEVIKQSELAKGDRADADFVERLSGAINASKSVQQLEVDLKSSNMSFVDKNGKEQFISGNLNDIEMMYESARANGESGEVLKKLAQAKENAAKQIEKDILTSVIDGTAESKGVSADTVQEINDNRRYIVEMQSNDRLVKTVDSSGNSINISFDTGNASDDADAILKTLDSALKNDNNDIRNIKHDVENAKRDLEKEKKNYEKQKEDLEKNKKKNQQTQRYRSQRADADAVNKKNKGN